MPYYNNGYTPGYGQMYPQPFQVQAQQNQQAQQNGVIWVQGEAAAKSYLVAPNSTVPLWDSEEKVIYLKSADVSGMPSMKILDYTIRGEEEKKAKPEYATKSELDALAEKVKELMARKKQTRVIREDDEDE